MSSALSRDEFVEELGDVQQIIWDICYTQAIPREELAVGIDKKTGRKGSYVGGNYIDSVTIPNEDDKWAVYCRRQPEKYPEIASEE